MPELRLNDAQLAAALADLGTQIAWPPVPDVRARVLARITTPRRSEWWRAFWSPRYGFAPALVTVALALIAVLVFSPEARTTATDILRLRGVEIYQGKPIFYSLGNFVSQFELMSRLSSHVYDALFSDSELPPHQVVGGLSRGFADNAQYWHTFVPVLSYDKGKISSIEIHPVEQGFGDLETKRGRPALARGEMAQVVIEELMQLSKGFGTSFRADGDRTWIELH